MKGVKLHFVPFQLFNLHLSVYTLQCSFFMVMNITYWPVTHLLNTSYHFIQSGMLIDWLIELKENPTKNDLKLDWESQSTPIGTDPETWGST